MSQSNKNIKMDANSDKRLSHKMSRILRHTGADEPYKLKFRSDGYVKVSDFLALKEMSNFTEIDLERVTNNSDKQRYNIVTDGNIKFIRANQGHSGKVKDMINDDELLTRVVDPSKYPMCVHGTYRKYVCIIKKEGLSRRERHCIHFATGEKDDESVISGMRKSANAFIFVDVKKAMNDGIVFYISDNGVLLTPGDTKLKDSDGYSGVLLPKYFTKIVVE